MLDGDGEFDSDDSISTALPPLAAPHEPIVGSVRYAEKLPPATVCRDCGGFGSYVSQKRMASIYQSRANEDRTCPTCSGVGFVGIEPAAPTICRPGSPGKLAVLSARYTAGFPLWHASDADSGR